MAWSPILRTAVAFYRLGEAAKLGSAKRAEELAADGDLAGVAVWLQIIDATGQLAITTPSGPVH
jgi:hypothetical protein